MEGGPSGDSWARFSSSGRTDSLSPHQEHCKSTSSSERAWLQPWEHMYTDVSLAEEGHMAKPRVRVGGAPRVWAPPGLMPW